MRRGRGPRHKPGSMVERRKDGMTQSSWRRLAAAGCLALMAGAASAQSWPMRPVRLIVPFPAGGTIDILGRLLGQEVSKATGQPFVVENKPGGGTVIGVDAAAKASDGHTSSGGEQLTVNATLVKTCRTTSSGTCSGCAGRAHANLLRGSRRAAIAEELSLTRERPRKLATPRSAMHDRASPARC